MDVEKPPSAKTCQEGESLVALGKILKSALCQGPALSSLSRLLTEKGAMELRVGGSDQLGHPNLFTHN